MQVLERLNAFALESMDRDMFFIIQRTNKKVDSVLPEVLKFVAEMMRPLMEGIDAVHLTRMSRILKVADLKDVDTHRLIADIHESHRRCF